MDLNLVPSDGTRLLDSSQCSIPHRGSSLSNVNLEGDSRSSLLYKQQLSFICNIHAGYCRI